MNRWLVIILLTLSTACAPEYSGKTPPPIVDGTIDLTGWDFERDGPVSLDGEWLFAWGEFVERGPLESMLGVFEFNREVGKDWGAIEPAHDSSEKRTERRGKGTYGFVLKVDSALSAQVNFGRIHAAAKVFVVSEAGGLLASAQSGRPGRDAGEEVPWDYVNPKVALNIPGSTLQAPVSLLILVHVSNFQSYLGGIHTSPSISRDEGSSFATRYLQFVNIVLIGLLLMTGIYHLMLTFHGREDRSAMWFGLFSLVLMLRLILMGGLQEFGLEPSVSRFEFMKKLELLTVPAVTMTFVPFTTSLIRPTRPFIWLFRGMMAVACLLGLTYFFVSVRDSLFLARLNNAVLLVGILILVGHYVLAAIRGVAFGRPALLAFMILAAGGVNDLLHAEGIIASMFVSQFTVIVFVLLQCHLIAQKFGSALADRNASNRALLETYQQLDDELLKRESLQAANAQLQQDYEVAGQQLIQADKLATIGTLVAGVAHDIANPTGLGRAAGQLITESRKELQEQFHQLLGDDDGEEVNLIRKQFNALFESIREGEEDIALATSRIGAINNAIRNQSRIEEGMDLTSVRPIIDECVTIVKSRLVGIKTEVECSETLMATVNRSQFGQVLMNLLANGADAIRDKEVTMRDAGEAFSGELKIRATGDSSEAFQLTIEDNGPGIPEEIRAKILEPFFTTKEVGKGTGLGMPIVIRILEHHGLKLEIDDSEALGGAKLTISHS